MKAHYSKIVAVTLVLILVVSMSLLLLSSCNNSGAKQVPVYQGMSISNNNLNLYKSTNTSELIEAVSNQDNEDIDNIDPHDDESSLDTDIEDLVTIEIVSDDSVKYYVQPNEVFIIEVHVSNPNDFEIQSFTLNGQKYANYMFKEGSTMELLLLEVTAPSTPGYVEYTIDAIKYIDGTEIKDVDMRSGNKSIKAGIAYTSEPSVWVIDTTIDTTEFTLDLNINDPQFVIGDNEIKICLTDGENLLAEKPLRLGSNRVAFDGLTMSKEYGYGIVTTYDLADGQNERVVWLLTDTVTTGGAFKFESVAPEQESVSFAVTKVGSVGEIEKITIYDAATKALIASGNAETTSFDNLLSNHEYNLYIDFSYTIEEEIKQDWAVAHIKTLAKAEPTLELSNFASTQTEITCDLSWTDTDNVGAINDVYLKNGDTKVKTSEERQHLVFDGLISGTKYTVVCEYSYNLNDGAGLHNAEVHIDYPTIVDSIAVDEITLLNSNVVKSGEELNMRIYFDNPSEIEMTSIYVNSQKVEVVGGDRIDSAIIKFVPNEVGLIEFKVDKVDYLFAGSIITQLVDSDVSIEYPIYGDLDIEFLPVTSAYYGNTGNGTYMSFENPHGYQVFKIDDSTDFVEFEDGSIYTPSNHIGSIEYGYANFGHTSQSISYNSDITQNVDTANGGYVVVSTPEDFVAMKDGYYFLANDIDLRNTNLTGTIWFDGILIGNGHKIRGLSNVIDTQNTSYFDIFSWSSKGAFYDVTFTELYISVNATESDRVAIRPFGGAKLVNCTVRGDIIGNQYVRVEEINNIEDSCTINLSISVGGVAENRKVDATKSVEKNSNVTLDDQMLYFTLPNGNKYLFGTFDETLTSYTTPNNIFVVGDGAFSLCAQLKELYISPSVQYVATLIFNSSCQLEKAMLPSCISDVPKQYLEELTLWGSRSYKYIRSYAFEGCTNLTTVTILDSVTYIESSAFSGCAGLQKYIVVDNNANYCSQDGILYNKDKTEIILIPQSIQGAVVIPDGMTSIGNQEFYNLSGLTSITIPDSVTSIEDWAFYGCTGLTSITIPDSVTSIGLCAFKGCTGLTSVTIPDGVTIIGEGTFDGCPIETATIPAIACSYINNSSLKTVVITSGESMGDWAFYGCTGLTSVTIGNSATSIGSEAFYGCTGLTSVTIGNSVTNIGSEAFHGCTGLTSITIPDSVTNIGSYAFWGCTGLTSVTIGNSATSTGRYTFDGCTGLTSVTIPDGVTIIGEGTFEGCTGLTSITIPDSVTSIERLAFSYSGLHSINYTGTLAQWNAISKVDSWDANTGSYTVHCTDGDIEK